MRRKMIETGLSQESLDILWDRYQNRETIRTLIADFNLNVQASQFPNIFPPISAGANCPYCTTGMVRNRKNRRAQRETDTTAYCLVCGHNEGPYCKCDACDNQLRESIKVKQQEKWTAIRKRHEFSYVGEHALATASLPCLMASLLVDLSPTNSQRLAPADLFEKWARQAMKDKILTVDLERCSLDDFNEAAEIIRYSPHAFKSNVCIGTLPLDKGQLAPYILLKFQEPRSEWKKKPKEIEQLWLDIAQAECLEYLQKLLNDRDFRGQKIPAQAAPNIRTMLTKRPTAVIFAVIYFAVKEVSDFYQAMPQKAKQVAVNMINGFFDKKFELAKKENSNIKPFNRDTLIPRSNISEIFVDAILQEAGDYCFYNGVTTWVNMQKPTKPNGKICCPNCDTDAIDMIQTDCQMFLICQECEQETIYALQ